MDVAALNRLPDNGTLQAQLSPVMSLRVGPPFAK
jgi:hypothetical protein